MLFSFMNLLTVFLWVGEIGDTALEKRQTTDLQGTRPHTIGARRKGNHCRDLRVGVSRARSMAGASGNARRLPSAACKVKQPFQHHFADMQHMAHPGGGRAWLSFSRRLPEAGPPLRPAAFPGWLRSGGASRVRALRSRHEPDAVRPGAAPQGRRRGTPPARGPYAAFNESGPPRRRASHAVHCPRHFQERPGPLPLYLHPAAPWHKSSA